MADEEVKKRRTRGPNSVDVLANAGLLATGTTLLFGVHTLNGGWQEPVTELLAKDPAIGVAESTGETVDRSLRWKHDGEIYSATGLTKKILELAGIDDPRDWVPGPDHWLLPDGRAMSRASRDVRGIIEA